MKFQINHHSAETRSMNMEDIIDAIYNGDSVYRHEIIEADSAEEAEKRMQPARVQVRGGIITVECDSLCECTLDEDGDVIDLEDITDSLDFTFEIWADGFETGDTFNDFEAAKNFAFDIADKHETVEVTVNNNVVWRG